MERDNPPDNVSVQRDDIVQYVTDHIGSFHAKRLASLDALNLDRVLKRKNPYLFKAKYALTSEQIIKGFVDAHISSNEETIFGDWLEGLAIFINQQSYGGWKSGIKGIDLEFNDNQVRYIVSIKSGPNWGNSNQIEKMKSNFATATRTLRTSGSRMNIISVNGCCYGRDDNPDKGAYFKYCGQRFWHFISGSETLYTDIIEPLGHQAREKNEAFMDAYARRVNQFTLQFSQKFCHANGDIDWEKLVKFNSQSQ